MATLEEFVVCCTHFSIIIIESIGVFKMLKLLSSFSKISLNSTNRCLVNSTLPPSSCLNNVVNPLQQSQQIRLINKKAYETEPGWKAFGYKWIVKFPEKYTIKKLPLMKLAGRDPVTGNIIKFENEIK